MQKLPSSSSAFLREHPSPWINCVVEYTNDQSTIRLLLNYDFDSNITKKSIRQTPSPQLKWFRLEVIPLNTSIIATMLKKIAEHILSLLVLLAKAESRDVKVFTISGNVFELNLADSTKKASLKCQLRFGQVMIRLPQSTRPKRKIQDRISLLPQLHLAFGLAPYVTKVIEINTTGIHKAAEFGIVNLDLDITLFRNENYMGLDFMTYTPIAKAAFNRKKGKLEWGMLTETP
jgi:hypothetical protein